MMGSKPTTPGQHPKMLAICQDLKGLTTTLGSRESQWKPQGEAFRLQRR